MPRTLFKLLTFHAPGEASPVGKDHEWELFAVEVADGLRRLVGRVREPHLPSLLDDLGLGVQVSRVGGEDGLYGPGLHTDHTKRHAAQTGTTHHNGLRPGCQDLTERVAVKEPAQPSDWVFRIRPTHQHPAGVIGCFGGSKFHVTVHWVMWDLIGLGSVSFLQENYWQSSENKKIIGRVQKTYKNHSGIKVTWFRLTQADKIVPRMVTLLCSHHAEIGCLGNNSKAIKLQGRLIDNHK